MPTGHYNPLKSKLQQQLDSSKFCDGRGLFILSVGGSHVSKGLDCSMLAVQILDGRHASDG